MQLRGTLVWVADGEPHRDEVLVSDERPNGVAAHVVILDLQGRDRASSPAELPSGSILVVPTETPDADVDRVQGSGYSVLRDGDEGSDLTPEERRAREEAMAAAYAELDEVTARLTPVLRARHPDLFEEQGRIRPDVFARKMRERTGGKRYLTDKDVFALMGDRTLPRAKPVVRDAP
jgi:hypothetical protein